MTPNTELLEELAPGLCVRFRPVRPEDKDVLRRGLARMSPQSRYLRFGAARSGFSETELRYLTEVDGADHVALLAFVVEPDGEVEAGVGRVIRNAAEPDVAELALAVMDVYQGRGLGSRLLNHLIRAARDRGIRWLECIYSWENAAVQHLIATRFGDRVVERLGSGQVKARLRIDSAKGI